jgi:ribonuclease H / adenosylcobalamin/alpha-ribazole phosphatase
VLQATTGTRLIFIRHGQIEANIYKLWYGSTDAELTDTGIQQATQLGQYCREYFISRASNPPSSLKPLPIYTSPLQRAQKTAKILTQQLSDALPVHLYLEAGLAEYSLGALEGIAFSTLEKEHRLFEKLHQDIQYAPPGGESLLGVSQRSFSALQKIVTQHAGESVVIVSHGALLALTFAILFHQAPQAWGKYQFNNTGISEILFEPEPKLLRLNETPHLQNIYPKPLESRGDGK